MKKIYFTLLSLSIFILGHSQVDTLSNNIYQNNGKLGIGTSSPQIKLHIKDSTSQHYFGYQPAYDGPYINMVGKVEGQTPMFGLGLAIKDYNYRGDILCNKDWAYLYGNIYNKGIAIIPDLVSTPNGLFINKYGFVGIGIKTPKAKLQVANGDIYISDIGKGIIMKSPDGKCWRGILDNSGQLNFTIIDCPNSTTLNISKKQILKENVLVFPNPTNNKINISNLNIQTGKLTYTIYNTDGKLKDKGKLKSNNQTIDISNLSNGIYILNIYDKTGNKLISNKIIKK